MAAAPPTNQATPAPLPPAAQLRAPALLFRRLGNIGGQPLDELVASAPLMLIASTVMSLTPDERQRHWVSSSIGKLESNEVIAIAGNWWGRDRHRPGDGAVDQPATTPS